MQRVIAVVLLVSVQACGDDRVPKDVILDSVPDTGATPDAGRTGNDSGSGGADAATGAEFRCAEGTCELTCDVLADPGFCWTLGLQEAYSCTDGAGTGVMSSDGLTCTAAIEGSMDSLVVEFQDPVVEGQVIERDDWVFGVSRAGEACLSFENVMDDFVLTTDRGTVAVVVRVENEPLLRVSCPSGDVWEATDIEGLLMCRNADDVTSLPGQFTTTIGPEFDVGLLPSSDRLFACTFSE